LAAVADQAGDHKRKVLEREICAHWEVYVVDSAMPFQVGMTTDRNEMKKEHRTG
jgi:hypothetical protein